MLQMHWYRQRPNEAYSQIPSHTSQHLLRFAWCCKVNGYLNLSIGRGLCESCYKGLLNKFFYEPLYTHFLSDGHVPVEYNCALCYDDLITRYPVSTCQICTQTHLVFLTNLEYAEQNPDDLIDPAVIYIDGHNFYTDE